jgi:hypothetical protein
LKLDQLRPEPPDLTAAVSEEDDEIHPLFRNQLQ